MPKLSPPSEGATSAFVEQRSSVSPSCGRKPTMSSPSSDTSRRVRRSRTASGSAPATTRRAPVRRRISGQARSSTCRPFRGSCRPAKTIVCSRSAGSACSGISTPFGTTSHGPPTHRSAEARACSETASFWSTRSMRNPQKCIPPRIQPSSPEAWWVATIGSRATARTLTQIAGVIGSWRCRTSNRSRSSTRLMRRNDRGLRTRFGSEPLAGTITERPTGITLAGGSPWRPTRGWSARVNCPGGSLPITSFTS